MMAVFPLLIAAALIGAGNPACPTDIVSTCQQYPRSVVLNNVCYIFTEYIDPITLEDIFVTCDNQNICGFHAAFDYSRPAIFASPMDLVCITSPHKVIGANFYAIGGYKEIAAVGDKTSLLDYNWMSTPTSVLSPITTVGVPNVVHIVAGNDTAPILLQVYSNDLQYLYGAPELSGYTRTICELGCGSPITTIPDQGEWNDFFTGKIDIPSCTMTVIAQMEPNSTLLSLARPSCATTTKMSSSTSTSTTTTGPKMTSPTPGASCTKSYTQTSSCIVDTPMDKFASISQPQDCANLCTSKAYCLSFNFRLGKLTCTQNECELFDRVSSVSTIDPITTTSASVGDCIHYDSN